jgi:phage replication O-like protein O
MEALIGAGLSGSELAVVLHVLRKTWGWHKKADAISIGQFQNATGCGRQTIIDALNSLVRKTVLVKVNTEPVTTYQFNKNYDQWLVRKTVLVAGSTENRTRVVRKTVPLLVRKTVPTKEKKTTLTKEISTNVDTGTPEKVEYGDPDVNRIYQEFEKLITPIIIGKKKARGKIKILINSLKGVENASKMIRMAAAANLDRYGPKCGSVEDLLDKQGKITVWARSQVFEKIKERSKHVTLRS